MKYRSVFNSLRFNRRLGTLLAVLTVSAGLQQTSSADTHVYLENKTGHSIPLAYSISGGKIKKGGVKTGPTTLANNKKMLVMQYSRGKSLSAKKTYQFTTTAYLSADKKVWAQLHQRVKCSYIALGPLKKSSISAALQTPNQKSVTYRSSKSVTKNFADSYKVGGNTYAIRFSWSPLPNGSGYHDLTYTITRTGSVTAANELTLLQYNIQQRPSNEGLKYQTTGLHSTRSLLSTKGIPAAIRRYNADVVTINEAFTAALRPPLISNMRKNGYLYNTKAVNVSGNPRFWSGGVMIFSKHRILKTADYRFESSASTDKLAAKGVQYAAILKGGQTYHIFATHTNASYEFKNGRVPLDDKGRLARRKQFREMWSFVLRQKIPSSQPVLMAGDMNVDMVSEKGKAGDDYSFMLQTLHAVHPARPRTSITYSVDAKANEWVADDEANQFLDYVLYSRDHKRPKSSSNNVIRLKVSYRGKSRDLSDHYPVIAKFTF